MADVIWHGVKNGVKGDLLAMFKYKIDAEQWAGRNVDEPHHVRVVVDSEITKADFMTMQELERLLSGQIVSKALDIVRGYIRDRTDEIAEEAEARVLRRLANLLDEQADEASE